MRFIFVLSFLLGSMSAFAKTVLNVVYSDPRGNGINTFIFEKDGLFQERKSNLPDDKKELWFGTAVPVTSSEVLPLQKKLGNVSRKLKIVDKFLSSENAGDRGTLLQGPKHGLRFELDGQVIVPDTLAFKDVQKIYEDLLSLKWKQQSGIMLSGDPLKVFSVKNGRQKEMREELHCRQTGAKRICTVAGFGPVVLE